MPGPWPPRSAVSLRSNHEAKTYLDHPLSQLFERSAESLTTGLGDASQRRYLATWRGFLRYLQAYHPDVHSLEQIERDPQVLGWLAELKNRMPPLAKNTRALVII